jgi:hypothetical protein
MTDPSTKFLGPVSWGSVLTLASVLTVAGSVLTVAGSVLTVAGSVVGRCAEPVVLHPAGERSVRLIPRRTTNGITAKATRVPVPLNQAGAGVVADWPTTALDLPAAVGDLCIGEVFKHRNRSPLLFSLLARSTVRA